ncbi:MAG TPA: acyltransferase [Pilimelia sp.]|nr:acyltransferase [Pilimelia sp.]
MTVLNHPPGGSPPGAPAPGAAPAPAPEDVRPGAAAPAGTPNPYHPLAWFVGEPVIGAGTWVGPFVLLDASGGLEIGRGCDIAAGAHIYTHSSARRCVTDRAVPITRAPVRVGDCTFVGAGAKIFMGVTIGDHCIVNANAVVTRDVPDRGVVAGVPARLVGTVDPATGEITYH